MKLSTLTLIATLFISNMGQAQTNSLGDRALWASINGKKDASLGDYQQHTGKVLVSWRMLPGDNADTGFDLYRTIGTGAEKKIATNIRNRTCFQDGSASNVSRQSQKFRGRSQNFRGLTEKSHGLSEMFHGRPLLSGVTSGATLGATDLWKDDDDNQVVKCQV